MKIITRKLNNYTVLSVAEWLDAGLNHGFMNAEFDAFANNGKDWEKVIPNSEIKLFKQVHGTETIDAAQIDLNLYDNDAPLEADGWKIDLKQNKNNVTFGIKTADCAPIIIFVKQANIAYILHSGWQGTVQNYLYLTLSEILKRYKPEEIEICVGPAANVCCYEVKGDVASAAKKSYLKIGGKEKDFGLFLNETFNDASNQTQIHFNNSGLLKRQAYLQGIPESNICVINACTICNKQFFSYRRGNTGREITFIAQNEI